MYESPLKIQKIDSSNVQSDPRMDCGANEDFDRESSASIIQDEIEPQICKDVILSPNEKIAMHETADSMKRPE